VLELVKAGGWPMIPLLLLTVAALAIIVERFWSLRRERVLPPGLGDEVRAWVARGKPLEPAHIESLRATAPLGALLAAELDVRHRGREVIRERVEDVGRHLVHRMERFLNALGTIAAAGPLLGLFGTVVGMIEMFLGILDHGLGDAGQLAGGIGKALICTATGMVVAIPALAFHRYFRGRIAGYIVDMEHEAMRLQDVLDEAPAASHGRQD
jgi:biopolymer transport protein ExbB